MKPLDSLRGNRKRDWHKLDPETGRVIVTPKIEDGSVLALKKVPYSLLKPESEYRHILRLMKKSVSHDGHTASIIKEKYLAEYGKLRAGVPARLSEHYTLGLVERHKMKGDKGILLYSLNLQIDVEDGQALFKLAVENQEHTRESSSSNHQE